MRFLFALLLCFTVLAERPKSSTQDPLIELREVEKKSVSIAEHLTKCTVGIQPLNGAAAGMGSGVIVDKNGLILTAAHVTQKAGVKLKIYMYDGTVYNGISLGLDHGTDAGMARITEPGEFDFTPMAEASSFKEKDWVIAMGHPGGVMLNRNPPVRLGRILKAGTASGFSDPITTDCTVISGDSGGPLFNLNGEVIGINSNIKYPYLLNNHVPIDVFHKLREFFLDNKETKAKFDPTGVSRHPLVKKFNNLMKKAAEKGDEEAQKLLAQKQGKIDQNEISRLMKKWSYYSADKKAFLGISLNLLTENVAQITEVEPGSPADDCQLQKGDIISLANGNKIKSVHDFIQILKSLNPGDQLSLSVRRQSKQLQKSCVLAGKPERQIPSGGIHMLREGGSVDTSIFKNSRTDREYLKQFSTFGKSHNSSVVKVNQNGKQVALGTIINESGYAVSKSSLIKDDNISCTYKGKKYDAKVVGRDKGYDIVLLKIDGEGFNQAKWASKDALLGSLLFTPDYDGDIVATGTVSLLPRRITKYGLGIANKSSDLPVSLGLILDDSFGTLEVNRVTPGSPADKVGLLEGEVLTKIDSIELNKQSQLIDYLKKKKPNDKVKVTLGTGKETREVEIVLGEPQEPDTKASSLDKNRDRQLHNLSRRGGKISKRRSDFPRALRHDSIISPEHCGGPILNIDGEVMGINIARSGRCRSYAIMKKELLSVVDKILKKRN